MSAFARRHGLTLAAGAMALGFIAGGRVRSADVARAIDVDLLLVLFALLTTIEILRVGLCRSCCRLDPGPVPHHAPACPCSGPVQRPHRFADHERRGGAALAACCRTLARASLWLQRGCGTIIASLANLLGWRIYVRVWNRDPRFFWRLTAWNAAFLAWIGAGGWLLLRR